MPRGASARTSRALAALAAVGVATCIAACGGSSASSEAKLTHFEPSRWLHVEEARKTATITLQLGFGRLASGLNIDGATKGALLFSVPSGWHVNVVCENLIGGRRYSCVLEHAPGAPLLDRGIVDVLHPTGGLADGQASTFEFTAPGATRYRLSAVSERRAVTAMWVVLKIGSGGRPYARWLR